jgi:hypothetical protein
MYCIANIVYCRSEGFGSTDFDASRSHCSTSAFRLSSAFTASTRSSDRSAPLAATIKSATSTLSRAQSGGRAPSCGFGFALRPIPVFLEGADPPRGVLGNAGGFVVDGVIAIGHAPPLCDSDQVQRPSLPERILDHGSACARPAGDRVDMQAAEAMQAHLVTNDSQGGQLARGEPGGEGRRHGPASSQAAAETSCLRRRYSLKSFGRAAVTRKSSAARN